MPTVPTVKRAILSVKGKQKGHEAVQKGNLYHHGLQKYRNKSVYPVDITPFHTKKKYARMGYYTLMSDDCNLAHTYCVTDTPNFLTGEIIETRSQASLQAPPPTPHPLPALQSSH